MLVNGNITEINVISIYQISEKQFSRVLIGSCNVEYPWQFTVLLFISSLLYHSYLLPYLHIFIYSFLFLHFALEFARCPYRILQINYVDVDTCIYTQFRRRNKSVRPPSIPFAGERQVLENSRRHLVFLWKCRKYLETKAFAMIKVLTILKLTWDEQICLQFIVRFVGKKNKKKTCSFDNNVGRLWVSFHVNSRPRTDRDQLPFRYTK